MKATIWHNPNCSTSRKTLEILRDAGADVNVVEYLKTPPTRDELAHLYAAAGLRPHEGLRMREDGAAEIGQEDDAVLDAMVANPRLIQRPLVQTEKGFVLARPQEKVREIL